MSAGFVRIDCRLCRLRRDVTATELGERSLADVAGPFLREHARHDIKLRWLPGDPQDEPDLESHAAVSDPMATLLAAVPAAPAPGQQVEETFARFAVRVAPDANPTVMCCDLCGQRSPFDPSLPAVNQVAAFAADHGCPRRRPRERG